MAIGITLLIIAVSVIIIPPTVYGVLKERDKKFKIDGQEKLNKACILKANGKYTDTIKRYGTPMTIGGEKMVGVSIEEQKLIENERLRDVAACDKVYGKS